MATIKIERGDLPGPTSDGGRHASAAPVVRSSPAELAIGEMDGVVGATSVRGEYTEWERAFPFVGRALGGTTVGQVAALSTVVGMECPGLHSVFGGFSIRFDRESRPVDRDPAPVHFEVERVDPRFSVVKLRVDGAIMSGSVTAFVRPRPTTQPTTADLRSVVSADEFADVNALIVGGSRGLGEATAKLIAAGGGHPIISWSAGRDDAELVAADIGEAGGRASTVHLDVRDADFDLAGHAPITHLLYFASPRIASRRLAQFDRSRFDEFIDIYVTGFWRVAEATVTCATDDLVVLYPSTVYVDGGGPDLVEYAAAKAAGEVAALRWSAQHDRARVVVERLPPLDTDQNASLVAVEAGHPVAPLLDVLRSMASPTHST